VCFVGHCAEHDPFSLQHPINGRPIFSRLFTPVPVNQGTPTPTAEDPLLQVHSSALSTLSATYPVSVTVEQPSSGETPVYPDLQLNSPGTGESAERPGWVPALGLGIEYSFISTL